MRTFTITGTNRVVNRDREAELKIDSGWDASGVKLDFQTTRGRSVSLTIEQWYVLRDAVEQIIAHCEGERKKGR